MTSQNMLFYHTKDHLLPDKGHLLPNFFEYLYQLYCFAMSGISVIFASDYD